MTIARHRFTPAPLASPTLAGSLARALQVLSLPALFLLAPPAAAAAPEPPPAPDLPPAALSYRIDARLAPGQEWRTFLATFAARGKARATLVAEVRDASGALVTAFDGRFVALRPPACGPAGP